MIVDSSDGRQLLHDWQAGDAAAGERLFSLVYVELRKVAAALLRHEPGSSLSTGDLVSEAILRLIRIDRIDWQGKGHFMAMTARVMRQVLIDQARARQTNKRAHQRVQLVTGLEGTSGLDPPVDLLDLNAALDRLSELDPERARIVEMRYFGGMSLEDIAAASGLSLATVKRRWQSARIWLFEALGG